MKLTPATAFAALAVIGAGGFFAGRLSSPSDAGAPSSAASSIPSRPAGRSSGEGLAGSGAPTRSSRSGERDPLSAEQRKLSNQERIESIIRGEDSLTRNRALLEFIDQLGPGEFEDAIAHFRSLGLTEQRFGEYSLLLTAWAKADPMSALEYATAHTNGGFARDTILSTWAGTDPDAALRWAEANFSGEGANPYLVGIIRGIVETDPARASELLTGMPRSNERGAALDAMLPHILTGGVEGARDWIASIEDETLRNGAIMRASDRLAAIDPLATADWLISTPGEASDRRLDDVLRTWASNDQEAALSYYQNLPAGDARSNALRGVISATASTDPQAAVAMLDRYSNDVNDGVVQNFIWSSFRNDPVLAANSISRISDPGERDNTYRRTIDNWLRRDSASAQSWLESAQLPNSVQRYAYRRLREMEQR